MFLFRLCCISPVLAVKAIPGCEVTVGSAESENGKWPYAETVGGIEKAGGKHVAKKVNISFYYPFIHAL